MSKMVKLVHKIEYYMVLVLAEINSSNHKKTDRKLMGMGKFDSYNKRFD